MIETSLLEECTTWKLQSLTNVGSVVDRKWYVCYSQYNIIPCTAPKINSNQEMEIFSDLQQFFEIIGWN